MSCERDFLMISSKSATNALADLCAAFISANGVKPEFYYKTGVGLVNDRYVSIEDGCTNISRRTKEDIASYLISTGYPRGAYVAQLVASRIHKAIDQINQGGGLVFISKLVSSPPEEASSMLLPLYGVGPRFIEVYLTLAAK